jgi:methanogenic corrinoid protein MtbC1
MNLIKEEKRNKSVLLTLEMLEKKEIDIVTLYQDVLAKTLNDIDCDLMKEECIWKEHVKTAIVRTIVEVSYPYVIKEAAQTKRKNKKVVVVCPSEEYHEIGAKMVSDFFYIAGYDTTFVGANTPTDEVKSAMKYIKPDFLAISITDRYNLIKAIQIVKTVKNTHPTLKIIIGGPAVSEEEIRQQIQHDYYLTTYQSIVEMDKE